MEYVERSYRKNFIQADLVHFQVSYKETDLDIGLPKPLYSPETIEIIEKLIRQYRSQLDKYIKKDPLFAASLKPHRPLMDAPPIAMEMAKAADIAGVGPMAAVAGAFSQFIAEDLLKYFNNSLEDIIIENGGDIYLRTSRSRKIGIFAGESPLSNRLALLIKPGDTLGICTSSGTVGPSLSFGNADAAVVISPSALLADAAASAVGNIIKTPDDVEKGVQLASKIPGIIGAVVIAGDKIAAWGQLELAPI